jgi:hypothetical protein
MWLAGRSVSGTTHFRPSRSGAARVEKSQDGDTSIEQDTSQFRSRRTDAAERIRGLRSYVDERKSAPLTPSMPRTPWEAPSAIAMEGGLGAGNSPSAQFANVGSATSCLFYEERAVHRIGQREVAVSTSRFASMRSLSLSL